MKQTQFSTEFLAHIDNVRASRTRSDWFKLRQVLCGVATFFIVTGYLLPKTAEVLALLG